MLLDLYIGIYGTATITKRNCQDLARRLNKVSGKSWGWTYMRNILKGARGFRVTPDLAEAIQATGAIMVDGQTSLQARITTTTEIGTINGRVKPGTVFGGESHECEYSRCFVQIIRTSNNQRYCCPEHAALQRKLNARSIKKG